VRETVEMLYEFEQPFDGPSAVIQA